MPDPATLPPELFSQIFDFAVQPAEPTDEGPCTAINHEIKLAHDFHSGINLTQLAQLALINWRWYAFATPALYARFSYNGACHSYSYTALWQFLRSIMSNPTLAAMVRVANIGNWGFYPDVLAEDEGVRGDNVEFTEGDVKRMRQAIRAAFNHRGVHALEARILDPQALSERDCRPLVVLLLMSLPNIETLYLHVPEGSSLLRFVLEEALRYQDEEGGKLPCLQQLAHLHLLAEVPVYGWEVGPLGGVTDPALRLDDIWPCVYFSGLRTLSLYGLEMEGIAALLAQHSHRICRVQHLRLAVKSSPTRSSAELQALVNLPQSLALFSIRWDHNLDDGEPAPEISVADVWDALQKHRESLEQLAVLYNAHELDEPTPGHFGSLQTFPYLKRLDIQLEVLLDGMTTERLAPFRLKDTIPDSLDCLFLYPGWVYEVGANFLATELQAMVAGRSRPLKVLALDGALAFPYNCEETGGFVDMPPANSGPYSRLWTLCKQAGTQLHVSAGCNDSSIYGRCEFHEGGTCGWVWRKTWTIRGDGIRRSSTRVERLPKPVPWENQIKTRTMALHAVPFTDHMGNEAFMVFKNGIDTEFSTLPPLFPFAVYFSHPGAIPSPDESDLVGLFIDIREGGLSSDFHFRLDVYFLPGASEVDCKTHYLAERASRADYETIIREFEDRTLQLSGQGVSCDSSHAQTTTRLPGMARSHPGLEPYRGLLLLCAQPVWRDGAERISCVLFDKLAVEDTTNEGEGDVHNDAYHNAPESTTRSFRIAYDSPKSGDDDEETIGRWLRHSTKDIQSAHEYEDLHSMAAGMGWTSW